MLKYCLVNSGIAPRSELPVGVEQWVDALGGELVVPEALDTPVACARYDVIHIVCCPHNDLLIADIRNRLGWNGKTRVILSLRSMFDARPETHEHDALVAACAQADLLVACDHATVLHYERMTGRRVHALPDPADLRRLYAEAVASRPQLDKIAFVMRRERFEAHGPGFLGRDVELFCDDFRSTPALLARLGHFAFICFDADLEGHDAELIYLAARGCAIIGGGRAEVIKRCFSLSAHRALNDTLKTLRWFLDDEDAKRYALECAADKLEYYNHGNSRNRLMALLAATGLPDARDPGADSAMAGDADRVVYLDAIHHVSGPAHVTYDSDEFVVVCLVKNGAEYLPSFLRHYRRIGATHFYFVDNESTDATPSLLADEPDVTVFRTALQHRKFESEIRRVIIEKHCASRWCMCVDIDELFEFPGSGTLTTRSFLDYLNAHGFTSVVAYMLDMFSADAHTAGVYLEDAYPNFDLSDVSKGDYFSGFEAFCDHNVLPCPEIGNYYGGVRQNHIRSGESRFLLTKHPLVFIDHHIEAVTMPHFCNKARIADVTCLLKHYKLTASLKERIKEGIRTDSFSFIIKDQIAAYLSLSINGPDYRAGRPCEVYTGVGHLVENGFLYTSERYRAYLARATRSFSNPGAHRHEI
jgi:hypothetical protein